MTLVFLKLGGSLITDKTQAETPRQDVLEELAQEVRQARAEAPELRMVLAHGSGSFGHVAARRHGTRAGVTGQAGWQGFAEVSDAAARLNRIVAGVFLAAQPPSVVGAAVGWGLVRGWTAQSLAARVVRDVPGARPVAVDLR